MRDYTRVEIAQDGKEFALRRKLVGLPSWEDAVVCWIGDEKKFLARLS